MWRKNDVETMESPTGSDDLAGSDESGSLKMQQSGARELMPSRGDDHLNAADWTRPLTSTKPKAAILIAVDLPVSIATALEIDD